MSKCVLYILTALSLLGCITEKGDVAINIKNRKSKTSSTLSSSSISSVQVINNQLVISGTGLDVVESVKVNGNSLNENFSIETKTATKIIANSIRAFSFDVSKIFNLILSDAQASTTFQIDFSLCNATLNGKGFNCAAPVADKDVLAYDAVSGTWKPRPASGLNYLGTFDASSNPSSGPATQPAGAYYVISDDGQIGAVSFSVGDWLVSNGSAWQKIDNSTSIISVFGRYGTITAQEGDYNLNLLTDVNIPTTPATGKVLKFDGTHWVAGDDLSGGGAGSVTTTSIADGSVTDAKIVTVAASKITGTITSSQITDGAIVNADINAAAAIDYSKLSIPAGSIPYAKLNIADGDIPAAKITGLPSPTSVLATTIVNSDTTHAPDGNAVFDALGLKMNLTGGTLSVGTIRGVPTPINLDDVVNKQYTDTQVGYKVSKSGDTMSGTLTLDSDLKIKGGSNYVTVKGHATSTAYDFILPSTKGTSGFVLSTDGNGNTSWVDVTSAVTGMDTDSVAEATNLYFTEARVLGTDLAGINTGTSGVIAAADTVLSAFGKTQYQLSDLKAKGQWNKNVNDISYSAGNVEIDTKLRLKDSASNYVEFRSPATVTTTYALTFPPNDGNSNQVLRTDGSGVLTWVDVSDSSVLLFAKTALPTCLSGEVLKSNGTAFSCVTDVSGGASLGYTPIDKAGDSITSGTFTLSGTAVLRVPDPVVAADVANKQYVDSYGQWTKASSDLYRLTGNVGIGNSAPNYALDVTGTTNTTKLLAGDGAFNAPSITFANYTNTGLSSNGNLRFSVNGGLKMTLNQTSLDFNSGGAGPTIQQTGGNAALPSYAFNVDSDTGMFNPNSSGGSNELGFSTGGTEKVRIDSTGKVGIGSTTPQSKLDVNGAIRIGVDATACSSTIAGAMRFNTPNVEFCNGTTWAAFGASGAAVGSSQITDATIVDADVSSSANIAASKLGTGAVDNTEFNYLDGVTSSIQTQLTGKQASDATLTALAGYNTNGILVQTAADTFIGRSIAGTANRVSVANGDGISGNPTVNVSATLLPSPVVGDVGKYLKATAADTSVWTALSSLDITTALGFTPINKAGDSLTTGAITLSGSAVIRTPDPVGPTDIANKQYVDGYGQWTKNGSDIYRPGGNVALGTSTADRRFTIIGDGTTYGDDMWMEGVNSATATPQINLARSRGTSAARTPVLANDVLGTVAFRGEDSNGGTTFPYAGRIDGVAETDFATQVNGALSFLTTSAGTINERMKISSAGVISANGPLYLGQASAQTGIFNPYGATYNFGPKIQIAGGNADSSSIAMMSFQSNGAGPNLVLAHARGNVLGAQGILQAGDEFGAIHFQGSDGSTGFLSAAKIKSEVVGTPAVGDIASNLIFQTRPAGGSIANRMLIDSAGNVGVGTSVPTARLDVRSGTNRAIQIIPATDNTAANGSRIEFRHNDNGNVNALYASIMGHLQNGSAGNNAGELIFNTAPLGTGNPAITEKMRITSAGDVGIGTSVPNLAAETNGRRFLTIKGVGTTASTGSGVIQLTSNAVEGFNTNLGNIEWHDSTNASANTRSGYISMFTSGSTVNNRGVDMTFATRPDNGTVALDRLRITAAGLVGVNTTNPTSMFEVFAGDITLKAGTTNVNDPGDLVFRDNSGYEKARIYANGAAGAGLTFSGHGSAPAVDMFISSTGAVGIGTASPSYMLHVNGSVAGTGAYNALSDMRLKKDITVIPNSLEKIDALRGVSFNWRRDVHPELKLGEKGEIGVIAQEVRKVFPEAITVDKKTGILSVAYSMLIAPLIEAVKELFHDSKIIKREIASIKKENLELKAKNDQLTAYLCKKDPSAPFCTKK